MTSDMSMTERLMRHKNRILQRQVDVKLKIMENEHKAAQKEILESQRDCSVFLANLSNTWVGLNEYDQPNTRAMAKDPRLKCRRQSVMPVNVMDNDHFSNNAEEHSFCHRQKRSYSPQSEYCFPEKRAEMTCITVLDDILQAQGKGRRKQERRRKIGILIVPNSADMNSNKTMCNIAEGDYQTSGSSKDSRSRPVSGVAQGIRRVSLVPDTLLLRSRNRSSSLACGDGVNNRNIQDVPVIRNIILPPRPQTVSQERFTHSIPPNKGISKRPQTAVTIRRSSIFGQVASDLPWQPKRPTIADPYALLPGEEYGRKRPKTAPTKYELYGRSPAVGRTTVAGIMAEMQNRRSETRRLLELSRQLKNKVKKLIRPERQYDPEQTEEQC